MADMTDASNPKITLAKEGIVVSEAQDRLHLDRIERFRARNRPQRLQSLRILHVQQTDIPSNCLPPERSDESLPATSWTRGLAAEGQSIRSRLGPVVSDRSYRRFALSTACLVLALVGIPLGLSSTKAASGADSCHYPAGLHLLRNFSDGSFARASRKGPSMVWSVVGRHCFSFAGGISVFRAENRPFELASFRAPGSKTGLS